MKRIATAAGAIGLALCAGALLPGTAFAATADTSWYVGHESDTSYALEDALDLQGLASLVNSGTTDFAGKTIVFKEKLPGEGEEIWSIGSYTPIGDADHVFNGVFDGQGLSVYNLSITEGSKYLGLFGNAGSSSAIRNVSVAGSITIAKSSDSTDVVSYVGGVVGCTMGSISNCTSSVVVNIKSDVKAVADANATIRDVGGVAGRTWGDVVACSTTSAASVTVDSSSGPANEDITWVAGYTGGVVGEHGAPVTDEMDLENPSSIQGCVNRAVVKQLTYAQGANDRFGAETFASGRFLGGIAGYSSGNISDCSNTGDVDSSQRDEEGEIKVGFGTIAAGGIVGGFRIDTAISNASDSTDPGYRYNKKTGNTVVVSVEGCSNTAPVIGLGQAGGVVGQAGAYTLVKGCYNTGDIDGTRWNKPSPGGVVGRSYGNICYCYNTGDVATTSGGGYYAAGIVGMLHSIGMDHDGDVITPEVWACYNTGYVVSDSTLYKAGSIVGELDGGFIHDTWTADNRCARNSVSGLDNYDGVMKNVTIIKEADITAASSVATLNATCDSDGWGVYYALPEGKQWGADDKGVSPVLVKDSYETAVDLSALTGATASATGKAPFSAAIDPVPVVSVKLSNGESLVQNADYRVVGQAGTKGVSSSDTEYSASIVGIGAYKGTLGSTAAYKIGAASLDECTIKADSKYFNFEAQKPDKVTVYDKSGNVIDESQYTWNVDESKFGQLMYQGLSSRYYVDAQDPSEKDGYPITVTAKEGGDFTGSKTDNCFKIKSVSFVRSNSSDNPNQGTFYVGKVIVGDQTWNFEDVTDYVVQNSGSSGENKDGTMKVKYTGQPILPKVEKVTYMGKELVELTENDHWYDDPKKFGYKVLYGNPNPEMGSATATTSYIEKNVNVTGKDYAVFTLRSSPSSNFDNYLMVWFEITPASIKDDVTITGFKDRVETASERQGDAQLTYNGMTLKEGTDYSVKYGEGDESYIRTVTYTGMGNYDGSVTKSYIINSLAPSQDDPSQPDTPVSLKDAKVSLSASKYVYSGTKRTPSVSVSLGGASLAAGTDYTVAYSSNINAGTAKVTVSGIGKYTGSVTASYTIAKASQSSVKLTAKTSTLKASKLKKKALTGATVKATGVKGSAAVSFKKKSGSSKLTVSSKGVVKVKKGTKKGTYSIKLMVKVAPTANFNGTTVYKTVKVKVK